jgi:hypothetical protein
VQWHAEDSTKPAGWKVADGIITVDKKTGSIITKQRLLGFSDAPGMAHSDWDYR